MNRSILKLAIPNIISNLSVPLLSSVDTILMGHLPELHYIVATASAAMRNSTIIATIIIFLPAYYVGRHYFGNHGLWLAMTIFMIARGVSLSVMAPRHIFARVGTGE